MADSTTSREASTQTATPKAERRTTIPGAATRITIPEGSPREACQRKSYASFGDDGTTATAGSYGNLMQITHYFGESPGNPSGFICAELTPNAIPYPYHASDRLAGLTSAASGLPGRQRILPQHPETLDLESPQLSFVNNRWPCFDYGGRTIQFFLHNGTVYETHKFALGQYTNTSTMEPPKLPFEFCVRLLDLNFTKNNNGFEKQSDEEKSTVEKAAREGLPGEPSTGRKPESSHSSEETSENSEQLDDAQDQYSSDDDSEYGSMFDDMPEDDIPADEGSEDGKRNCLVWYWQYMKPVGFDQQMGLFISPFIGDEAYQPVRDQELGYIIPVSEDSWMKALDVGILELTFAYTLQPFHFHSKAANLISPVSEKALKAARRVFAEPFELPKFGNDSHLDFVFWRNVEHILSVCSINVSEKSDRLLAPSIALTSGDVASHRIGVKASFHAFRILLLAMNKLLDFSITCSSSRKPGHDEKECSHGGCRQYYRIRRVCFGHMVWLRDNWMTNLARDRELGDHSEREQKSGKESRQVWVNGKSINRPKSNAWLSSELRTEIALQIIKIGEYFNWAKAQSQSLEWEDYDSEGVVSEAAGFWSEDLGRAKKNDLHMFARWRNDVPNKFYFADHAIIWWAILSAERTAGMRIDLNFDSRERSKKAAKLTTSQEFQRNILRRFTTENATSRTPMIAKSLSLSEVEFFLDVEDTLILYAADNALFKGSTQSNIPAWRNTMNCQKHYLDNDESDWRHPLQFALAMIMTSQGIATSTMVPERTYGNAKSVLLRTSSPSGLMAGQLDSSRRPMVYQEKPAQDAYWSTTFEIPYILWRYRLPHGEIVDHETPRQNHVTSALGKDVLIMKRNLPAGNDIDRGNILELSDDWLYDEPDFFGPPPDLEPEALRRFCSDHRHCFDHSVVKPAIDAICATANDDTAMGNALRESVKGRIDDVSKGKTKTSPEETADESRETQPGDLVTNSHKLCSALEVGRSRESARKRLLQFFQMNPTAMLICCIASPERETMAAFFDRHNHYQKYFSADVVVGSNKWVTELHLSFWDLHDHGVSQTGNICPQADEIQWYTAAGKDKWVRRAVTSFRFDGDFIDRYWTCHFVEHNPANDAANKDDRHEIPPEHDIRPKSTDGKLQLYWQQRKVLELVLMDRILQRMVSAAERILKESQLLVHQSLSSEEQRQLKNSRTSALADALTLLEADNNDAFLTASKLCHQTQYLLRAIHDDINENLNIIQAWSDREKDRHRTRWTQKDERKYRENISRWQLSNTHRILDLERCRANIASYNSSLGKKLEDMRSELEIRGADDIRLFTYVTAFFLPIGFATGVFSMSEAPSWVTLGSMIGTGMIALLITLLALFNAKFLERTIVWPIKRAWRKTSDKFPKDGDSTTQVGSSPSSLPPTEQKSTRTWLERVTKGFRSPGKAPDGILPMSRPRATRT